MKVFIHPPSAVSPAVGFAQSCADMLRELGIQRANLPGEAELAIAPHLTRFLPPDVRDAPRLGTLIFHPSALPLRRGPDAVRWAVMRGDAVSAATWFKADDGLDTGPICASEAVVLNPGESPGRTYHTRFVPAALRGLRFTLLHVLQYDELPLREQDQELATYQSWYTPKEEPENPIPLMGP